MSETVRVQKGADKPIEGALPISQQKSPTYPQKRPTNPQKSPRDSEKSQSVSRVEARESYIRNIYRAEEKANETTTSLGLAYVFVLQCVAACCSVLQCVAV